MIPFFFPFTFGKIFLVIPKPVYNSSVQFDEFEDKCTFMKPSAQTMPEAHASPLKVFFFLPVFIIL